MTAVRMRNAVPARPTPRLADYIKRRRHQLGITKQEVARAVNIGSADYLSLVESGKRRLELDRIPALALVLKVNAKELCLMAIGEVFPQVEEVLSGNEKSTLPSEDLSNKGELESFRKLMMLDRAQRQPILDTIDALHDMRFRQRKGA